MRKDVGLLLMLHVSLASFPLRAAELIDPTRPPGGAETAPPTRKAATRSGWTLESTLVATDRRVAVINGELVTEGESVGGARVVEIRKLEVLVQTPRGPVTLRLLPDILEVGS